MNKQIKELEINIAKYMEMEKKLNSEVINKIDELNRVIDSREYMEDKIKRITEERKEEEISRQRSNYFSLTNDNFTNALKKASLFCSTNNSFLSNIVISENQIMATSGYLGIIIDAEVPEKNQNKQIHWNNLNGSFKDSLNKAHLITALKEAYRDSKENSKLIKPTITKNIFEELKISKKSVSNDKYAYIIPYKGINLAIDVDYMDDALKTFDQSEEIKVILPNDELGALLIESILQKVIIMPIRLNKSNRHEF